VKTCKNFGENPQIPHDLDFEEALLLREIEILDRPAEILLALGFNGPGLNGSIFGSFFRSFFMPV
jgi:hypothetical protein